jgi:hypothetical protein
MDNFSVSTNIERDVQRDINYITTPNAKDVFDRIVANYQVGHRSFNIIGSYGTGKSSFLWAFEKNLRGEKNFFVQLNGHFNNVKSFRFLKIVGEARSIREVLAEKLGLLPLVDDKELFKALTNLCKEVRGDGKILIIVVV